RSFFVLLFFLSVLFHSSLLRFLFFFLFLLPPPPPSTLFPYTTLFRSPETPSLLLRSSLLPPLAFSKCFYCIILDSEMSKKRIVLEENHTKSNGGQPNVCLWCTRTGSVQKEYHQTALKSLAIRHKIWYILYEIYCSYIHPHTERRETPP